MLFFKILRHIQHVETSISNLLIRKIESDSDCKRLKEVIGLDVQIDSNIDCFIAVLDNQVIHTTSIDYTHHFGICLRCKWVNECWGCCWLEIYKEKGLVGGMPICEEAFSEGVFPKESLVN